MSTAETLGGIIYQNPFFLSDRFGYTLALQFATINLPSPSDGSVNWRDSLPTEATIEAELRLVHHRWSSPASY